MLKVSLLLSRAGQIRRAHATSTFRTTLFSLATTPLVLLLSLVAPTRAHAQAAVDRSGPPVFGNGTGSGGAGLGIGAAAFLGGATGVDVVYDQPRWHIEGMLGFDSRDQNGTANAPTQTNFTFGVRGWYHLHQGTNADFSIGGGVAFDHFSVSNNGPSGTETLLEPGAQARVFLSPNFALFGIAGFALNFGDAVIAQSGIALAAHFTGAFGFTYFFR
jgi:hypothetical protein